MIHQDLCERISVEVDSFCAKKYNDNDGQRTRLGGSVIGGECEAQMWLAFRWTKRVVHDGRKYRLFNRGHAEELKFVEFLNGIGFECYTHDEAGNQFAYSVLHGHYGGSIDGVAKTPMWFRLTLPVQYVLLEFKTCSSKYFGALCKKGMREAFPKHYAQVNQYMRWAGLSHCLYMSVNKDTDEIHYEIVEFDSNASFELEQKAFAIITSKVLPPRISTNRAFYQCKMCDYSDICHDNAMTARNCRSCLFASAHDNLSWFCGRHAHVIEPGVIPSGCDGWISIVEEPPF